MLIGENILLALNGLRANKMRSLLTMLGIIIGIASVIAIMTLGDSISSSVTESMSSMGANNVTIGVSQKSSTEETTASGTSLAPIEDMDSVTELEIESPSVMIAITDAIPIIMPSIVRRERILFARRPLSASRIFSPISIRFPSFHR